MRTARGSAAAALTAHPTCTTITTTAGPRPPYRRALGLRRP
ncbi:hypothetical protein ACGF5O_08490 [Streptomyces sp. NPDC048291]